MWGLLGFIGHSSRCEQSTCVGKRCIINCFIYLGTLLWPLPSQLGCWSVLYLGISLKPIKSRRWRGGEHQPWDWPCSSRAGGDGAGGSDAAWLHGSGMYIGTRGQRQVCIWIASWALSSFAWLITVVLMSFSHTCIFRERLVKSMCGASHNFPICAELPGRHIWNAWPLVKKDGFWKGY